MANIKNYGLAGVGPDVQLGKAGPRLIQSGGVVNVKNAANSAFANVVLNDLTIQGNLTVQGDTTTLNVATLNVEDKNITLGSGTDTAATLDTAGLQIGTSGNIAFTYDHATLSWKTTHVINLNSNKLINVLAGTTGLDGINWTQFNSAITTLTTNLGTEVTNRTNADATIQSEIDAIEAAVGLSAAGAFVAYSGTNYLDASTTIRNAISALDTSLKTVSNSSGTIQTEIDTIETAVGLTATGTLATLGGTYATGTVLRTAVLALDTQLAAVSSTVSGLGTMSTQNATAVAVTGGAINGTTIGATTPSTGAFTTLTASTSGTVTGTFTVKGTNNKLVVNSSGDTVAIGDATTNATTTTVYGSLKVNSTANTGVLFNSGSGIVSSNAGLTFDIASQSLTIAGNIIATTVPTLAGHLVNKAYVDSAVTGGAVNAAHAVATAFTSATSTTIASVQGFVHRVKIYVNVIGASSTAFTLGTDASVSQLAGTVDIDSSEVGVYVIELAQTYATPTTLKLFNTGGAGSGYVVIEYI